jgi:hypothetical protein
MDTIPVCQIQACTAQVLGTVNKKTHNETKQTRQVPSQLLLFGLLVLLVVLLKDCFSLTLFSVALDRFIVSACSGKGEGNDEGIGNLVRIRGKGLNTSQNSCDSSPLTVSLPVICCPSKRQFLTLSFFLGT